jgi:ribosomal-protein-alanine N-acetyltransferase
MVIQGYSHRTGYNVRVDFTLRDFQRKDFDALWRIDQGCFDPEIAYSRRELAAYIGRRGAFTIVAELAGPSDTEFGRIAGFIVAESYRGVGHIISIDVLSEHRRSGLGSLLLKTAEERLKTIPCQAVRLEAAVNNAAAIAFYKRHGYSIVGTIPRYYPGGLNAFVFSKDLAQTRKKAAKTG